MPRKPLADKGMQTSLRLPRGLYDQLVAAAGDKGIGEEIRRRLEASLTESAAGSADPRFKDLLTAVGYVAAGAAEMYPARKVAISEATAARLRHDGKMIDRDQREVEDITAHWVIEAAVLTLLDAFRPVGFPDSLPKDVEPDVARGEAWRRASLLVARALGELGERGVDAFSLLSDLDQEMIAKTAPGKRLMDALERRYEKEENNP